MTRIITLLILAGCVCASGCGTVMTLSTNKHEFPQNRKYVYSGVRQDCWLVFGPDAEVIHSVLKVGGVVDLPFSALADTACLPYTIPKAIIEKRQEKTSNNTSEQIP